MLGTMGMSRQSFPEIPSGVSEGRGRSLSHMNITEKIPYFTPVGLERLRHLGWMNRRDGAAGTCSLQCDYSWEDMKKCLLSPGREPVAGQSPDATEVPCGKSVRLLNKGLGRGNLREQMTQR